MLDAVPAAGRLDEADRVLDGRKGVVLETERQRQVEEDLGVGRALDLRVEGRVDGEDEIPLDRRELPDEAVVHPEPAAVAEGMAVRLLDRAAGRGSDMGEDERRDDVAGQILQVPVVPGRLDAVEHQGHLAVPVPADPEPIAVRRGRTEPRVEALVDQGVGGLEEQLLERHRRPRVREPSAHGVPPTVSRRRVCPRADRLGSSGSGARLSTIAGCLTELPARKYRSVHARTFA
jgi:hypothetical protein